MGVIIDVGVLPVSMPCAAEAITRGYLYKDNGSGLMTVTADDHDVVFGVAIESSLDYCTGGAKTLAAGEGAAFALMNSGMIVEVASIDSATYSFGCKVYASDTNGHCDTATSSAVCIGSYWGKDGVQVLDLGELIPVRLDRTPGATT